MSRPTKVQAEEGASAKQLLMDKAIEDATIESIKDLIGEEKTERSLTQIQNKIIKQSGRYILSVKGENFSKTGNEYSMDVNMKLSLKSLRALLLENGLLYQLEGPPKVLPVVQVIDRVNGRRYGWWYQSTTKDHKIVSAQLESFHKSLRDELQKIGFYSLSPLSSNMTQSVPDSYRSENLQRNDYLFLGEYFKSSVVLRGQILFREKPSHDNVFLIEIKLIAEHASNGRQMAEVVRSYETEAGPFRDVLIKKYQQVLPQVAGDISTQLSEGWKKGTFGASILKLAVVGKITPLELEDFKKVMILQVRDIKSMRERLIEARKTTFEIDSTVAAKQLAQSIKAARFAKYKVNIEDVTVDLITIKVESTNH